MLSSLLLRIFLFLMVTDNNFIKVSRVLATATPRPRSAWGHEIPQNKKRRKMAGNELVHSDIGKLLIETESIFDIEYKVAFPKDHDRHMAQQLRKKKSKLLFQKPNVKVKNGKQQPSDTQQVPEAVDILSRMKLFNVSLPPKFIAKNVDGQTALDVLKALEDVGMVGLSQFGMKTPSSSDFASFNPVDYEHATLTTPKSKGRYNVLKQTVIKSEDRDLKKQSRKSLKQHLASLALDDITGPNFDWTKSTYSNLKMFLMADAGVDEIGKVSLTARLEEFNLLLPPEDPIENKDGVTAIVCLNQLRDVGMIGKTRFAMKSPSKSKYASFNPLNYEHVQLTIKRAEDKHISVLREDLYFSQDRDVKKQTRRALRQHLASLALCDLTGPRKRWSEMTFPELRDFLKEKSTAAKFSSPPVE
jgi:hypothetical protein